MSNDALFNEGLPRITQADTATAQSRSDLVETRLRELKLTLNDQIAYQLDSLFPKVTGWGAKGEIKRRHKLIRLVEPTLVKMLFDDEEVLYVAKGVQYTLAENYLFGAFAALMNQSVLVLTNARLLMMRSNSSGKPSEMFWVIYYSEILEFKANWTGGLNLKLHDQKKLKFTGFPKIDRQSIPVIFQQAFQNYRRLEFTPHTSQSRETLCCRCFHVIHKGEFFCEHCGAEYWRPRDLALRSLIFPSWGDVCMKHYGLALVKLFGYVATWIVAAIKLTRHDPLEGFLVVGFIFLIEHPIDAILTYNIASKGLNHRRDHDLEPMDDPSHDAESEEEE
ncbi:zinc ribbon domain-containing protein [Schlesneria paludicola]|uniref:zinc ribbon domain-containing protein n=1 Tax=Schlesneria paludicola TaxID=360056 RepID=UPI00029B3134|nr:zinc ribbon domain-containing protein [Schlesneria paludicola]